ncbi:hypothetical protein K438DRAFT_1843509 [Mycena galopus ATCC 62051]|nr:hypothetical protein K438DRAFT_1843509 [Mycena galopus ATCC 62051]
MASITCSPTPSFFDAPTAHADPPTQGDGHLVIDLSGDDSVHSTAASDEESMEEDVDDDTDAPYIPQPILPANLAYIFPNVLLLVLKLCHNDLLARNFSTLLSGTEKGGQYARRENTYMQLPDGKFVLRPHFRALYTERLINCAGLIATALNHERVGSRGFTPAAIRVSVPRSALDEAGLDNVPSLLVFLAAKWQLDEYRCDTAEQVMQQPDDFVEVFRYGVAVLGRIMVSTIENGEASVCNPGAGIGMSKAEFLERTGGRSLMARNIDLWLSQIVLGYPFITAFNNACGRLFVEQTVSIFWNVEANGNVSIVPSVVRGLLHDSHTICVPTTAAQFGQDFAESGGVLPGA